MTRAWDILEVGKSLGTVAQPLGPWWSWASDAQAGSVTLSPAVTLPCFRKGWAKWSLRIMLWDHRQQLGSRAGSTGIWIHSAQGLWGLRGSCPAHPTQDPHRVPLGPGLLLLEASELPAVVDGDEELPDEQGSQADEQDGSCHREQHHQHVWPLRAVWRREKGRAGRGSAPPGQLKAAQWLLGSGYMELLSSQEGFILHWGAGASTLDHSRV